ncbi:MAG: D-glycero-alpha-D-manno-heptose-7-phosphate kinase [Microgenomates group bacterium Gr01-1014_16]|nr:MAG: D-glycero-alpha-D-manno-heptose-7-phosphate kinase [Microgenomates group bacterium Gr01-1014_16]
MEGFYREYGGCVITTAIDKYVYCIVKERFDKLIVVGYSIKETVGKIDELKHELVREAMKKTGVTEGIEISFLSDIPAAGSGLGSSSSVTVGVLNALYQYTGRVVEAERLARETCEIEIDILKKSIGVQDQYIAAYGGINFMEFRKDGTISVEPLGLSEQHVNDLQSYMMVFFTGKTRQADTVLKEQKENIEKKNKILQEMAQQARVGRRLLISGNMTGLGKLLDEGWKLKKQLASKISNENIDKMYTAARKAGALGGKISGAGGGGFMTLFVPTSKREKVRSALHGLREMPVGLSRDGSKVIFNIQR